MGRRVASGGQPPSSKTGVEVTEPAYAVGVHWMRGVALRADVDAVIASVAAFVGESVERLAHGRYGYADGYAVGPVRVFHHPANESMGVCVEVEGAGCEVMGTGRVASLADELKLRVSRLDLAVDGCPFTPADLRREWVKGNVRTRVKKPDVARLEAQGLTVRPGLEDVRVHKWHESTTGTTFYMGSRASEQYARVYDQRGPVRFELELKGDTAAAAAPLVWEAIGAGNLGPVALGLIRRFVDFVDAESDAHASRRDLLPMWAEFVSGVERATLSLEEVVERTLDEVWEWLEHQAGPALALIASAGRLGALQELARRGRLRWREKHRDVLARSPGWAVPSAV